MRYVALACDFDGTLASGGCVAEETLSALERFREDGRKLILVTGRELPDLFSVFSRPDLFDQIVAENGAVIYQPESKQERVLSKPPPDSFVQALKEGGVVPLSFGRVVVATRSPNETIVLSTIRELGLELQVIFNKGAVMVLPTGVNKATGLRAALEELELSPHNVVAVGDAENDHAFLNLSECSVAVGNALPALKEGADWVTENCNGSGVRELIAGILEDDLRHLNPHLVRHHLLVGMQDENREVRLPVYGLNLLIAGTSGAGKSSLARCLLEQVAEAGYQFCLVDPEGEYESFGGSVILGNKQRAPSIDEVSQVLHKPEANPVLNLVGLALEDRPDFLMALLPRLQELRLRFGRPHWIVIDEAHRMLRNDREIASILPKEMHGMILVTVEPNELAKPLLSTMDTVITLGKHPTDIQGLFKQALGNHFGILASSGNATEALFWSKRHEDSPYWIRPIASRADDRRHRRKYAEGDLAPANSFYFRGPENKLNLRAHNLILFIQLAEGVDDATWSYHLTRGDYSRWFGEMIKDEGLAEEAGRIEAIPALDPLESRRQIRAAIEQRYTLPSSSTWKEHL